MTLVATAYRRREPWRPLLEEWGLAGRERARFGSLRGSLQRRGPLERQLSRRNHDVASLFRPTCIS
jgi:hypothetical protein